MLMFSYHTQHDIIFANYRLADCSSNMRVSTIRSLQSLRRCGRNGGEEEKGEENRDARRQKRKESLVLRRRRFLVCETTSITRFYRNAKSRNDYKRFLRSLVTGPHGLSETSK